MPMPKKSPDKKQSKAALAYFTKREFELVQKFAADRNLSVSKLLRSAVMREVVVG